MIAIIDYGLGNLSSIKNMLRRIGIQSIITNDPQEIEVADKLILPGVGAFDNGMNHIVSMGLKSILDNKVLNQKTPILGICLGMQLLSESSEEGIEPGLGWIKGRVKKIHFNDMNHTLKIPHMGWNTVHVKQETILSKGFYQEMRFYFVHSYNFECKLKGDIIMSAEYGGPITAAVQHGNIMGTQFHPEKSHKFGMMLLKNFADL